MNQGTHPIPTAWLSAYHDGELDEPGRSQLEAHLAGCPTCQHDLEALEALSQALTVDMLADQALPSEAALWERVKAQLPDQTPTTTSLLSWLPGIGLLLMNGLVQFVLIIAVEIPLVASQVTWLLPIIDHLDYLGRLAGEQVIGLASWLLPAEWSWVGLILFLGQLSLWLAALYLAWLTFSWRYKWRPIAKIAMSEISSVPL